MAVQASHPCILSSFDDFLEQASGKRVVVFLDYDGTLTPIVSNPDHAFMSPAMRGIVKEVGRTFPTAIISGRGRLKVEDFVQLDELFYAGSHGLDIKGPVVRFGFLESCADLFDDRERMTSACCEHYSSADSLRCVNARPPCIYE